MLLCATAPFAGCALIVGDPHGDRVFADASAGDAGEPSPDSPSGGSDAPSGQDAPPGHDAPSGQDAPSGTDSSMPDVLTAPVDAAADAPADADAAAPDAMGNGCPGTAGPPSVRIPMEAGASYCIDSTEITNTEYAALLASGFALASSSLPVQCASDAGPLSLTPSSGWPSPYPNLPVNNVSWCQAYTYCAWAGKRLCGEIGGGALPQPDFASPALSQWFNACSAGGTLAYPYGNTFDVTICGGNRTLDLQNAGTPAQCVGGFPGIYNMSGNLWEWTDSCSSISCYAMGGAYDGTQSDNACTGNRSWTAVDGAANIGFRCCSDP
jgi:hypothetical protein